MPASSVGVAKHSIAALADLRSTRRDFATPFTNAMYTLYDVEFLGAVTTSAPGGGPAVPDRDGSSERDCRRS